MASKAELDTFNRAVSHWSNQFAPELRRVAYVIGSRMGWDHNEFQIAWSSIQRHYEKAHGETISPNTLKKHARNWADAGGLKIIAGYRENAPARPAGYADKNGQQRGGKRQNCDASTAFGVDFSIVVKSRRAYTGERGRPVTEYYTEPWSFGQTAPAREESQTERRESTITDPSMTPHSPLNDPSLTPYSSFDFSENSSPTSSSTGPGEARDDDGVEDSSKAKSKSKADDDRDWLGEKLGVTPARIGWNAVELSNSLFDTYGVKTLAAAAQQCREKGDRPVAYFIDSAESMCAEIAAAQQAEAERQRQAEEDARTEAERRAEADRKRAEREAASEAECEAAEAAIEALMPEIAQIAGDEKKARSYVKYVRDATSSPMRLLDKLTRELDSLKAHK